MANVSYDWNYLLSKFRYRRSDTKKLILLTNVTWEPIAQYPTCQYFDPLIYYKDLFAETAPLQIYIYVKRIQNFGVSFYFEDRNRVAKRRQKKNMLAYSGPTFENADLNDNIVMR